MLINEGERRKEYWYPNRTDDNSRSWVWANCLKKKAYLEGLEIIAGIIRKDRIDARKQGMESLLLLTDATRSCPESADMASRAILCFGGDGGSNKEGLGSNWGRFIFYFPDQPGRQQ